MLLRQSTAVTLTVGPFQLSSDGFTPATGLTIAQASVRLSKNGGSWAQKNETSACTHQENGNYSCALNTVDTNTLGVLKVCFTISTALQVWESFQIIPATIYDALVAGTINLVVTASAVLDKTGYTVNVVNDKTGYTASTVLDKTGYTVSTVTDKTGYRLSAAGIADIAAMTIEGAVTLAQTLRGMASALFGKASGLATTTAVFRDVNDTKNRITATVDANGNRTAITTDLT